MNKFDKIMIYFISISIFILAIITVFKLTDISTTANDINHNLKQISLKNELDSSTDAVSDCLESEGCETSSDSD